MHRTWRDRVYSGSLRPPPNPMAETKATLINTLTQCMMADPRPHNYNDHAVSMIEPGLYLGDGYAAMNLQYLQTEGFTHILNMAEGIGIGSVNTNANYYRRSNIKYKGFNAYDRPSFPLESYFIDAVKYIQEAINSRGTTSIFKAATEIVLAGNNTFCIQIQAINKTRKILVHCVMGISRSASAIIAYLIVTKKIRASQALKIVYQRRIVQPNDGFMEQLARFSNMQERNRAHY